MRTRAREKRRRDRYDELERMLEGRRLEIMGEVQHKLRDVRTQGAAIPQQGVRDEAESSEAKIQDDIEFALLQMKAETLNQIGKAVARLAEGTYGNCYECRAEIAEQRLRALPFAIRCTGCEEALEVVHQRERVLAAHRGSAPLFTDVTG